MKIGLKLIAVLFAAVVMAGCGGSSNGDDPTPPVPPPPPAQADGWMLAKMGGSQAMSGKVYLQLLENKSFNLYQCIQTEDFRTFTGTYKLETVGGVQKLSGTYSNGTAWKDQYEVKLMNQANMNLMGATDQVLYEYTAGKVPDYVKNPVVTTSRSEVEVEPFL